MKQHKWHKEIKAWADGLIIQYKDENFPDWIDTSDPDWDTKSYIEFRIKPQPKTPKQAWDEELTRSYKETIIERLRNDDKFYDEVFSAYDNAKDNEIKPQPKEPQFEEYITPYADVNIIFKPQPKEPQYLYVWNLSSKIIFTKDNNGVVIDTWDPKILPKYIGKIKLEVEDE